MTLTRPFDTSADWRPDAADAPLLPGRPGRDRPTCARLAA